MKSGLWKILLYFRLRICTRNWCQPEKIWSTASKRSQGNSVVETYTEGIAFPKSSHWRKLFQEDLCEPDPIGLGDPIGIVSNLVKCDWDDVACCVKIAVFVILLLYCERCYSTAMMIGVWLFYSQKYSQYHFSPLFSTMPLALFGLTYALWSYCIKIKCFEWFSHNLVDQKIHIFIQ